MDAKQAHHHYQLLYDVKNVLSFLCACKRKFKGKFTQTLMNNSRVRPAKHGQNTLSTGIVNSLHVCHSMI